MSPTREYLDRVAATLVRLIRAAHARGLVVREVPDGYRVVGRGGTEVFVDVGDEDYAVDPGTADGFFTTTDAERVVAFAEAL